jgi:hypothetical protein
MADDGIESKMKGALGPERWPAFKRLLDEFKFSLRSADDGIDLLRDAITRDDFERWAPRARKDLDIANARFGMIAPDLEPAGVEYAAYARNQLSELGKDLARLLEKGPPATDSMSVTGEYER